MRDREGLHLWRRWPIADFAVECYIGRIRTIFVHVIATEQSFLHGGRYENTLKGIIGFFLLLGMVQGTSCGLSHSDARPRGQWCPNATAGHEIWGIWVDADTSSLLEGGNYWDRRMIQEGTARLLSRISSWERCQRIYVGVWFGSNGNPDVTFSMGLCAALLVSSMGAGDGNVSDCVNTLRRVDF
jgi:hypothetical protein